jgi:hypothetical protein
MEKEMAMVHFISKMAGIMKDNGKMIKCTVLVNFFIRMEQ